MSILVLPGVFCLYLIVLVSFVFNCILRGVQFCLFCFEEYYYCLVIVGDFSFLYLFGCYSILGLLLRASHYVVSSVCGEISVDIYCDVSVCLSSHHLTVGYVYMDGLSSSAFSASIVPLLFANFSLAAHARES